MNNLFCTSLTVIMQVWLVRLLFCDLGSFRSYKFHIVLFSCNLTISVTVLAGDASISIEQCKWTTTRRGHRNVAFHCWCHNTTCSIHEVQKLNILFRTLLLLQQCLVCYSKIQNKICASGHVPEWPSTHFEVKSLIRRSKSVTSESVESWIMNSSIWIWAK